jgi:hypothetical protein
MDGLRDKPATEYWAVNIITTIYLERKSREKI